MAEISMAEDYKLIEKTTLQQVLCDRSCNNIYLCKVDAPTGPITHPDGSRIQLTEATDGDSSAVQIVLKLIRCHQPGTNQDNQEKNESIAKREFDMLWQNRHENIVQVFQLVKLREMSDYVKSSEDKLKPDICYPGFFMECGDFSLYHVLHEQISLYPSSGTLLIQCLNWMRQAACALSFLHVKNVMHRDVKSHNMLLFNRGTLLKLCDLELAKDITNDMSTDRGTWTWMAPEILTSQETKINYGKEVDVYAFGMTLFECLFRQTPFKDLGKDALRPIFRGNPCDRENQPALSVTCNNGGSMSINIDWSLALMPNLTVEIQELLQQLVQFSGAERLQISEAYDSLSNIMGSILGNENIPELIQASLPEAGGAKATTSPRYIISQPPSKDQLLQRRVLISGDGVEPLTSEDCRTVQDILGNYKACVEETTGLLIELQALDVQEALSQQLHLDDQPIGFIICARGPQMPITDGSLREIMKLIYGECQRLLRKEIILSFA